MSIEQALWPSVLVTEPPHTLKSTLNNFLHMQDLTSFDWDKFILEHWVWWHTPVLPVSREVEVRRPRFKTSLGNMMKPFSNIRS